VHNKRTLKTELTPPPPLLLLLESSNQRWGGSQVA